MAQAQQAVQQDMQAPANNPQSQSPSPQSATDVQPPTTPAENVPDNAQESDAKMDNIPQADSEVLDNEDFNECWLKTVETLFSKKPAFYHQLKDYIPKFENGIITIEVENEFQEKQIGANRKMMIQFWNDNFANKVSDIKFEIHEHEKKKVIYTSEDKVMNMMEQNPNLKDFLKILNFRVKE